MERNIGVTSSDSRNGESSGSKEILYLYETATLRVKPRALASYDGATQVVKPRALASYDKAAQVNLMLQLCHIHKQNEASFANSCRS